MENTIKSQPTEEFIQKKNTMLNERRHRVPIKVPHNLSHMMLVDKSALKGLSVYFELKPLYYSGVIKNSKARAAEIAEFLGICPRTLHTHLCWLKKHGFINYDKHKNLYLVSLKKLCEKTNKILDVKLNHKKCHELSNDGQTEYRIRALAIQESRIKQHEVAKAKVFSKEKYEERVYSDLQKGILPQQAWERYHQQITEYTYKNKTLRREKRLRLAFYSPAVPAEVNLVLKYNNLYKCRMTGAEKAEINPHCTLSCSGVARLITGSRAPSSGHYWEQRLAELDLMRVFAHHVRLERTSAFYRLSFASQNGYYNPYTRERMPMYERVTKKGEVLHFRTLPNNIVPILKLHQTSNGIQRQLSLW